MAATPMPSSFGVGLEEDLSRRDFTIGAMAWNAETGEVIDPFGGQADLENRLIRAVGEPDRRFAEDGLRILRGLRFAAVLGFEIEPGTADALRRNAPRLKNLSPERVKAELERLLCGPAAAPVRGSMLMSLGWCCRSCCDGGLMQNNPHHRKDVWEHTRRCWRISRRSRRCAGPPCCTMWKSQLLHHR